MCRFGSSRHRQTRTNQAARSNVVSRGRPIFPLAGILGCCLADCYLALSGPVVLLVTDWADERNQCAVVEWCLFRGVYSSEEVESRTDEQPKRFLLLDIALYCLQWLELRIKEEKLMVLIQQVEVNCRTSQQPNIALSFVRHSS